MICSTCGHDNEKGKFCVKCGAPISGMVNTSEAGGNNIPPQPQHAQGAPFVSADFNAAGSQTPLTGFQLDEAAPNPAPVGNPGEIPAVPSLAGSWNKVKESETAKQSVLIGKQYGTFFLKALTHPFQTANSVGAAHFTNSLITILLIAILFPFIFIIGEAQLTLGSFTFGGDFLKPFFLIFIALLIASAVTFAAIRLARVSWDYLSVTAKFGSMLVPAIASLVLCILSLLLEIEAQVPLYLALVTLIIIFGSVSAVIIGARKESTGGLDLFYGMVVSNLVIGYVLFKFFDIIIQPIISDMFGGIFPPL